MNDIVSPSDASAVEAATVALPGAAADIDRVREAVKTAGGEVEGPSAILRYVPREEQWKLFPGAVSRDVAERVLEATKAWREAAPGEGVGPTGPALESSSGRRGETVALYVTRDEAPGLKALVAEMGGHMEGAGKTLRFVPESRLWHLHADTVEPEVFQKLVEATARYRTEEAKAAWEAQLPAKYVGRAQEGRGERSVQPSQSPSILVLYVTRDHRESFKKDLEALGVTVSGREAAVRFDGASKTWQMDVERVAPEIRGRVMEMLVPYRTEEARKVWEAQLEAPAKAAPAAKAAPVAKEAQGERAERPVRKDRPRGMNESRQHVLSRSQAAFRLDEEMNPGRTQMTIYPLASQRQEVMQLLVSTSSLSIAGPIQGSRVIRTDSPELFKEYATEKARGALMAENDMAAGVRKSGRVAGAAGLLADARGVAAGTASARFMQTYGEKGFLLANPSPTNVSPEQASAARERYESQMQFLRIQPTAVLRDILAVSRERAGRLRDKENVLRAQASGMTVDDLIQTPRELRPEAAKAQVLSQEESRELFALQRGIKALYDEMLHRKVVNEAEAAQEIARGREDVVARAEPVPVASRAEPASPEAEAKAADKVSLFETLNEHLRQKGMGR